MDRHYFLVIQNLPTTQAGHTEVQDLICCRTKFSGKILRPQYTWRAVAGECELKQWRQGVWLVQWQDDLEERYVSFRSKPQIAATIGNNGLERGQPVLEENLKSYEASGDKGRAEWMHSFTTFSKAVSFHYFPLPVTSFFQFILSSMYPDLESCLGGCLYPWTAESWIFFDALWWTVQSGCLSSSLEDSRRITQNNYFLLVVRS